MIKERYISCSISLSPLRKGKISVKCTSLFFFTLKSESDRIAATVTQHIHQAQAQTEAAATRKGSGITLSHIAVPVSAVVQLLFKRAVLHIVRIHCAGLRDMLFCCHIISGTGICHCAVIIPLSGALGKRNGVQYVKCLCKTMITNII